MNEINLPPFYAGQKVVALVTGFGMNKGDQKTVISCFKHCCQWHIDIGLLSPVDKTFTCKKCNSKLQLINGKTLYPEAVCFAPVQENFQSISLEKVLEEETKLISVN